jgi:hypothetical protein
MLVMGEYVGFLCVEYYSGVCLVVLKGDDGSVMVFFGWAESFLTLIEIFLYSFIIN